MESGTIHPFVSGLFHLVQCTKGFPGGSVRKEFAHNARDLGLIPGSGRAPGEGNSNPLVFLLENSMDRGAWWATVHGVTKSRTLSFTFTFNVFKIWYMHTMEYYHYKRE